MKPSDFVEVYECVLVAVDRWRTGGAKLAGELAVTSTWPDQRFGGESEESRKGESREGEPKENCRKREEENQTKENYKTEIKLNLAWKVMNFQCEIYRIIHNPLLIAFSVGQKFECGRQKPTGFLRVPEGQSIRVGFI